MSLFFLFLLFLCTMVFYLSKCMYIFFTTIVAVIGFSPDVYAIAENLGNVTLTVLLLNGQLGRDVVVTFSTDDGTATG